MSVTEDFATLFEGRKDAYGTEEGGALRASDSHHVDTSWYAFAARHLSGAEPIGVYPMVHIMDLSEWPDGDAEWWVKWGCVDLDVAKPGADYDTEEDAHEAAENLVLALREFGVTGWIERTRSGGRHVWVFALYWVPAKVIRRALLVACELVNASTREVNPKQESLPSAESLGNYVRLPYPGGDRHDTRFIYPPTFPDPHARIMDGEPAYRAINLLGFVRVALATRAPIEALEHMARLWSPPPVNTVAIDPIHFEDAPDVSNITPKLGGLAYTIWRDGPLDGSDRSTTLARLAHLCRDDGLTPQEALALMISADSAWGKFWQRRDGVRQLEKMIERAYADFDDLE